MSEKMNIENSWNQFAFMVISRKAPEIQREEMKNAFYAGFTECFAYLKHVIGSSDNEDDSIRNLQDIEKQIHKFMADYSKKHGV